MARMKDVRRYRSKTVSLAQLTRKFKEAFQALGELAKSLLLSQRETEASDVEDIQGMLRSIQKQVENEDE